VRRALTTAVVMVVAVVLQVSVVNRLPLPYGAVPSIVLILVAGASVRDSPVAGAITGFAAGLALDIAPPGSHLVGEYALVYCLVGYGCGHAAQLRDAGPVPLVVIAALGAAAGEAASAMLGLMFSDPEVTWTAISRALPAAVIYDVLLAPFGYGLMTFLRPAADPDLGRRVVDRGRRPLSTSARPFAFGGGVGGTGVRLANGSLPRLNLAGLSSPAFTPKIARREPKLKLAGLTSPAVVPRLPRRDLKLNLVGSGPRHTSPGIARPVRVSFGTKGGGVIGGRSRRPAGATGRRDNARVPRFHQGRGPIATLAHLLRPRRHAATPGRGWLKVKPPAKPRTPKTPGRKWLSSKPSGGMRKRRYAQKNWVRSSRRRRARSRLGGWR
jgi:rod shape-determining protein MreD